MATAYADSALTASKHHLVAELQSLMACSRAGAESCANDQDNSTRAVTEQHVTCWARPF